MTKIITESPGKPIHAGTVGGKRSFNNEKHCVASNIIYEAIKLFPADIIRDFSLTSSPIKMCASGKIIFSQPGT